LTIELEMALERRVDPPPLLVRTKLWPIARADDGPDSISIDPPSGGKT